MQRTANPCTSVQFRYRPPTILPLLFRLSSAVEQSAVNRSVACSNQAAGAIKKHPALCVGVFFVHTAGTPPFFAKYIDEISQTVYLSYNLRKNKMIIANFREYTSALREIYTGETMAETGNYYYALMNSGKELIRKKAELQRKIYILSEQIKCQAEKIRMAKDKKAAGIEMQKLKKSKQELIKKLKEQQDSNHFNTLSTDAKACVCSGFLLQIYLTRELLQNNPLNFALDNAGNMIVNPQALRQSDIFQETAHLKDFVTAYIAHYPEKVKTPGHFKTMLNGVNTWTELLTYANNFFETMNDNDFLEEGPVKASRLGTETLMEFPEKNLQLVRLHTEKALDYESDKMKHCVGKGGYDQGVKNGKIQIYSLRDNGDGEWLPHATIEYKDGKITQIKGYDNKKIAPQYLMETRQAVLSILEINHQASFTQNTVSDYRNIEYIADINNNLHDIYGEKHNLHLSHLEDTDELLKIWPPEKISVNELKITQNFDRNIFSYLQQFQDVKEVDTDKEPKDILERRDIVARLNEKGIATGTHLNNSLGFENVWCSETNDPIKFCISLKEGFPKIDILDPPANTYVKKLSPSQISQIPGKMIGCKDMQAEEQAITPEMIKNLEKLIGIYNIEFDKCDFSKMSEINLQHVNFIADNTQTGIFTSIFFLEQYNIPLMPPIGGTVIIKDCKNLPPLTNTHFPKAMTHLMIQLPDGENSSQSKAELPDFSQYPNLQCLQLNNMDLSENKIIKLPKDIKYLAFYKCKFGSGTNLDLSKLDKLEKLRLNECDLTGVTNIAVSENLKKIVAEKAKLPKETPIKQKLMPVVYTKLTWANNR